MEKVTSRLRERRSLLAPCDVQRVRCQIQLPPARAKLWESRYYKTRLFVSVLHAFTGVIVSVNRHPAWAVVSCVVLAPGGLPASLPVSTAGAAAGLAMS